MEVDNGGRYWELRALILKVETKGEFNKRFTQKINSGD
jgi:hypothetical protein